MIKEYNIQLNILRYHDVSSNEEFKKQIGELIVERDESEVPLLDLFFLLNVYRNRKTEKNYIFTAINNLEEDPQKSGLKNVRNFLSSDSAEVEYSSFSSNTKHELVMNIIDDICREEKNENFIEVSSIRSRISHIIKNTSSNSSISTDWEEIYYKEDIVEAKKKLGQVLLELHRLGVIVYFNDNSINDVIIPKPQFFNQVNK